MNAKPGPGTNPPPGPGPRLRTDLVDVFLFRFDEPADRLELLQLRRTRAPGAGLWHPIMGHVEPGEAATRAACRELKEEVGLDPHSPALLGLWQLEQVHPYFVAEMDAIVLSPRLCARVGHTWEPTLDDEHDDARWITAAEADAHFLWPGQRAAIRELIELMRPGAPATPHLRVPPPPHS